MTAERQSRDEWRGRVAVCAACRRERPCYHARSERPLCRSCYRRENIGRWNIARWQPPVAVCSECGEQRPAFGVRSGSPLCGRCHRRRQPKRPRTPPSLAVCGRCERERPCRRTAAGELVCSGCRRKDYRSDWTPPIVRCSVCRQNAPGYGVGSARPVCRTCRRRELAAQRDQPYRRPLAVCSDCGRERPCYFAGSERPVCHTCRWRGWQPPTGTCTVCGRERPCHHAHTERAICRSCKKRLAGPVERCLVCCELRLPHRRVHGRPECAHCAGARMRRRVDCRSCGRLLRPAASDESRCERCAGEPVLHECCICRAQHDHYDEGRCAPCGLTERIAALRAEADPSALAALEPYLAVLAASSDAWSTVRWMRTRSSYQALRRLARGEIELSHEGLDAEPGGRSIDHLRDALIAARVLPRRAEQAATFERAAARLLASLPDDEDRTQLRAFAGWHQHRRLLRRERGGESTRASMRHELGQLRAIVQLASWAHGQGHTLRTVEQHDLDRWLDQGPVARRRVACFLDWAARAGWRGPLTVPPIAVRRHTDQLAPPARVELARRLLDDDTLDLRDRVGGLLVLLLAQPASRLLMLTVGHISTQRDRVTVQLGPEPLELPEPIGRLVTQLAQQREQAALGPPGETPGWLFAGGRRAAPLGERQFTRRLRRLGITILPARTGALLGLAASAPPAILADLLGISEGSAARWSQLAAGDWARYAAHGPAGHSPTIEAQPSLVSQAPGRAERRGRAARHAQR